MEFADIANLLGSYCFPIVACIAMFWQMNKMNENHKSEMDKVTEALNNNTVAITKLSERMGVHE